MTVKFIKITISLFLISSLFLCYIYYNIDIIVNLYKKDLTALFSNEFEVDLINYSVLSGDFHNGFTFNELKFSEFSRYEVEGDLIVKINFLDFIYSGFTAFIYKEDSSSMFNLLKGGEYKIINLSFVDLEKMAKATAKEVLLNGRKKNLSIEGFSLKKGPIVLNSNTIEYSFRSYTEEGYLSGAVYMDGLSVIHNQEEVVLANNINLSNFDLNKYKLKASEVKVHEIEKLNIEEMIISKTEHHEQEEPYFEIYSLNNTFIINSELYSFNISASINNKDIIVNYLDVYNGKNNIINVDFRINLSDRFLLGTAKTSNLNIFGVKPEKSLFDFSSSDLEKYRITFSMYNVEKLVKKKIDKLKGDLSLKCNTSLCADYNIEFNENIIISDEDYRGEFQVKNIKDIDEFDLEVRSSFINLFKSNRLERVK